MSKDIQIDALLPVVMGLHCQGYISDEVSQQLVEVLKYYERAHVESGADDWDKPLSRNDAIGILAAITGVKPDERGESYSFVSAERDALFRDFTDIS